MHFPSFRSIYLWSFMLIPVLFFVKCSGKNINYKKYQRAITPTLCNIKLWFLCTAPPLNKIYLPMKFQVDNCNRFWVMLRTNINYVKYQRAITPTLCIIKLWFLCTALLLNMIYLPMKFHVDTTYSFCVMLRTKFRTDKRTDKRTDGRTDKRTDGQTKRQLYAAPIPDRGAKATSRHYHILKLLLMCTKFGIW